MMKLKIAFMLGIALSTNAQSIELNNFDMAAEDQKTRNLTQSLVFPNKPKPARRGQKGRPSHYDPDMGKQTFIWAPEAQTATNLQAGINGKAGAKLDDMAMAKKYLAEYFPRRKSNFKNNILAKSVHGEEVYPASSHVSKFGPMLVKFKQKYNGIDVFAREANILMDKDRHLVAASGYLADSLPAKNSAFSRKGPTDMAANAIHLAYADMGVKTTLSLASDDAVSTQPYVHYDAQTKNRAYDILDAPRAKRVFYEYQGVLLAAHYVEVSLKERRSQGDVFQYGYVISEEPVGKAASRILFRKNQVQQEAFAYRTFADTSKENTPFRGPMKNIYPVVGLDPKEADTQVSLNYMADSHQLVSLESGPISTGDPWLADGATETLGNNVNAYADIVPGDGFSAEDLRANTSDNNTFDWSYDPEAPASDDSRKAAVVNLFYMNNWLHDYFYDFGFDEASGNAQNSNYDRGGLEGDVLRAEAQDYSGVNNANMSTPADGRSPRMQMYIFGGFHSRGETYDVNATLDDQQVALTSARLSFVGSDAYDLVGELVLIEESCIEPFNTEAVSGKIALVFEGGCDTAESVKYAQDAGAKAVILVGLSPFFSPRIYQADSGVVVPNVSIHRRDGDTLIESLTQSDGPARIHMRRDYIPNRDGTLANGIVAHEWGHYLTNRLIGDGVGLINTQGRGMGEGWSDFLATYFAIEEEDRQIPGNERFQGLYSSGGWADRSVYYGIRRVPYSTDMNYNAVLFENVSNDIPFEFDHPSRAGGSNALVHNQGEFWANTLLEVYVSLLNDSDRLSFQEAKARMAYYLVGGLKLTPIAPTYTEARDGLLAMAYATDRKDYERMIAAFAKRGLGVKAVAAPRFSDTNIGVKNSFDIEEAVFSVISSRLELEKTYGQLNLSEHSDPLLSNLSFLDDDQFQCPKDGVLDIFEFGEVVVEIDNTGNVTLDDITAKVTSDAGHGIYFAHLGYSKVQPIVPYSNAVEIRVPFVLFNATTAQTYSINIEFPTLNPDVDYPESESFSLTVHYDLIPDEGRLTDNLENTVTAKNDWVVQVDQPQSDAPNYQSVLNTTFTLDGAANNELYDTGQMWSGLNNSIQSDVSLISPVLEISDTEAFRMHFDHAHFFEPDFWDGGVVEVRIDGGAWTDVVDAGATLLGYAYNGEIRRGRTQALSERDGFVNNSGGLKSTTVDFETLLAGRTAQFRFRIGTDFIIGAPGWLIDNIGFEGITNSPFSKIGPNKQWCGF